MAGLFAIAASVFSQPPNDDPCGAIELQIEIADNCIPSQPFSWENATASPDFSTPSCGSYSTGDIWFFFSLPEQGSVFITTALGAGAGAILDGAMQLFRADECTGTFTLVNCNDDSGPGNMPQMDLPGLEQGTYYIRFWDYQDKTTANFGGICVSTYQPPPPPVNDDPCSAISLEVAENGTCIPDSPYSWENASITSGISAPACGSANSKDLWFTFELTATSKVVVRTAAGMGPGAVTDGVMELFSGVDCENLILMTCDDDGGTGNMPQIEASELSPGTYFIRFWPFNGQDSGNIGGICVESGAAEPEVSNDWCSLAFPFPEIPLGGECVSVTVNTTGASGGAGGQVFGDPDDDVWFSFVAPDNTTSLVFELTPLMGTVLHAFCVYDACGSFFPVKCYSQKDEGVIEGLTPGQTYYIRAYTYESNTYSIFEFCLKTPPPPPVNDECDGAVAFQEIPLDGSCSSMLVDTRWSSGELDPDCYGEENDDVWYTFTVPAGVNSLIAEILDVPGGSPYGVYKLFSGSCNDLQALDCTTFADGFQHDVTPGATYYLRAHTAEGDPGTFEICLRIPPDPPVNDDCPQAIPFPVIPNDGTCASLEINTTAATGDGSETCFDTPDDDVWYTFIVPPGVSTLWFEREYLGGFSPLLSIFSGACDDLQEEVCVDFNQEIVDGLVGGQTYYLRVYSYFENDFSHFNLCIKTLPPAPVNDLCEQAEAFPVIPADGSWVSQQIQTLSATGPGDLACGGWADDDLWYTFDMPLGFDRLRFKVENAYDASFEVYSGNCDALELVGCYDPLQAMSISGLTGGQTYFLRAYTREEGEWAAFSISLAVPEGPLLNDYCMNAISFPPIPLDGACATVTGETGQATGNLDPNCVGAEDDDLWYTFVVPAGVVQLNLEVIDQYGGSVAVQLFEGDCQNMTLLECLPFLPEEIFGLNQGQTYFLRVYSFQSGEDASSGFELCLSAGPVPPHNDECDMATSITADPGQFLDPGPQSSRGATVSPQGPCDAIFQDAFDVWYSFVTDEDGGDATITIYSEPDDQVFFEEMIIQGFEGGCDELISLGCVGQNDVEEGYSALTMYGLAPLTTYFFRIFPFAWGGYSEVPFTLHAAGTALDPASSATKGVYFQENGLEIQMAFPSPTSGLLNIRFFSIESAPMQIRIVDLMGQSILTQQVSAHAGTNQVQLDLSSVPPGLYVVFIEKDAVRSAPIKVIKG